MGLLKKIFGDYSQKEVKRIRPLCNKVLDLEAEYSKLTDEQLRDAGADILVAGNYVFKAEDPLTAIHSLYIL